MIPPKQCCDTWEYHMWFVTANKLPILQITCFINNILDHHNDVIHTHMSSDMFTERKRMGCNRAWHIFCPQGFGPLSLGHNCIMLGIWISLSSVTLSSGWFAVAGLLFHKHLLPSTALIRHWPAKTPSTITKIQLRRRDKTLLRQCSSKQTKHLMESKSS